MYSTRRLNKNVVDGAAYITIGDPYNGNKAPLPERWKGKRLSCPPPGAATFTPFTYASEPYVAEAELYIKTQPVETRKNGFGSRDASKRDKHAMTRAMEAYREQLRKEMQYSNKRPSSSSTDRAPQPPTTTSTATAAKPRSFLYDIGRGRTTEFNPKLRRDTFYPPQNQGQGRCRGPGPYRRTSEAIGEGVWATEHAPPDFGSTSCTKAFLDHSHLHVGLH